jgi:hypothetical protein
MYKNKAQDIEIRYETKNVSIKKYIDLDSTFRNRLKNPLSSNFTVDFNKSGRRTTLNESTDPVSLAYPYETGTTLVSSSTSQVQLPTTSSQLDNFYINSYIGVQYASPQYRQVIAYSGSIQLATVNSAYSALPSSLPYNIREQLPSFTGYFSTGTTTTNLLLTNANYNIVGNMIRITTGADNNQVRNIYNELYTGGVFQVTVSPPLPFTPVPLTDTYEILPFSYDNTVPLIYSGTTNTNQAVCYRFTLISLVVPSVTLKSSYGSSIRNYPYLYVKLKSATAQSSDEPIYSNNPNSIGAVFKVPVEAFQYLSVSENEFITLNNINMTQAIKFKPNDSLQFGVTTPDGEYLQFVQPDNMSPLPPNPFVQISVLFEIERID